MRSYRTFSLPVTPRNAGVEVVLFALLATF
jgi:hypothetical protein